MSGDIPLKQLGEVCDIIGGGTPSKKREDYYGGSIPWATVRDMNYDIIENTDHKITQVGLDNSSANIIPKDNVVLATRVGLGKVCKLKQDTAINQDLKGIIPKNNNLLTDYLFLWFKSISEKIIEAGTGATVQGVKIPFVKNLQIPLPPLPEQKRIAALLNDAFEAIDKAKANVERNIENAEELFQSKLNEIISQRGKGWESNKLKDITTKIGSGATPRGGKKNYKESGISLIRSLNVYDDGFEEEKLAFIDEEQARKLSNVELYKGDVLLNITGASVARCCVVPENYLPARVNQHVSIIRLEEGVMDENFLHYLLISKLYKDKLLGIGEHGATRQAITKAQIQDFEVSYPSELSEQKKLISILDEYRDLSNAVKDRYEAKLRSIEELKKSILQNAFSGELTEKETVVA